MTITYDRPSHTGFGGMFGQRSPLAGHATVLEPTRDPAEAMRLAGLDWTVEKRPLWFTGKGNGSKPVKVKDHFATVKVGAEQLLGTVRGGYTPVQNADAFTWAQDLGDFVFAGSLRDGGQTYVGVKMDLPTTMAGDAFETYMVLWNGHDGSKSVGGMVTPIRLRCMNQLAYAKSTAVAKWFARHTSGVAAKSQTGIADLVSATEAHLDSLGKTADRLAGIKLSGARQREVLSTALGDRPQLLQGVLDNLTTTDTLDDDQRETGWGLLQATTEYFEWVRVARTRESALQSTLDGVGARAARALQGLLVAA